MEQVLVHTSWLSREQLAGRPIIRMCQTCGNTDELRQECPNCDVAFEDYVYMDAHPLER